MALIIGQLSFDTIITVDSSKKTTTDQQIKLECDISKIKSLLNKDF